MTEKPAMTLNHRARRRCDLLLGDAAAQSIHVERNELGSQIIDCGVTADGGLQVGVALSEVCLADLGQVRISPARPEVWSGPSVVIRTDRPVAACMASQYAGWQLSVGEYFAMGSGPMRAVRGREKLFSQIGYSESPDCAVGVLESSRLPDLATCQHIADECRISPEHLTLLIARTASLAGTFQVVARTVETALHKLHEVGFDLRKVVSGFGVAPLPPVAANDLVAIGRTNDAVLYGGEVTLWVRSTDEELTTIGPRIPSCASADFGRPFAQIFEDYGRDFYKIDPMLFSPAVIRFCNLESGHEFEFGSLSAEVLRASFAG